jgi:hypothetical protein
VCETWSLTLREEHRLRVFENRMLRIPTQEKWALQCNTYLVVEEMGIIEFVGYNLNFSYYCQVDLEVRQAWTHKQHCDIICLFLPYGKLDKIKCPVNLPDLNNIQICSTHQCHFMKLCSVSVNSFHLYWRTNGQNIYHRHCVGFWRLTKVDSSSPNLN